MPPFTRSRSQEFTAYCESVTKLAASDLIEEGTQCPICYGEIAFFASIYLHRGCANVVCSSCFESSLSQHLGSDVCLICKGYLAEPCSSSNSSSDDSGPPGASANGRLRTSNETMWLPLLSPKNKVHSGGSGQPDAGAKTAYNTGAGLSNLAATIDQLKAELENQREVMSQMRGEGMPNRDNQTRSPPRVRPFPWQATLDPRPRHSGHRPYQDNTSSESQNNSFPWNRNTNNIQHQNKPRFQRDNDTNTQPRYNSNPQNQDNRNPQNGYNSNAGPLPNPNSQNQHDNDSGHGNDSNHHGPDSRDPRIQRKSLSRLQQQQQQHRPRGHYGDGLDPATAHHHNNSHTHINPHSRPHQPHQHNRHRGPKQRQSYNSQQNNSSTQSNQSASWTAPNHQTSNSRRDNQRHALGNGGEACRRKTRMWNGVGPPPNINQYLRHARSFPSGNATVEMDSIE